MHDHELKEYQRDSLEALAKFCDEVRLAMNRKAPWPVHDAFRSVTNPPREYFDLPKDPDKPHLAGVPYVCLRVPTGGGKTLIAAHAVGTVAKRLGRNDYPLCLWVTPSTTIRDQTIRGLKSRDHPYHRALKEMLGVPLEVMTLDGALSANRSKTDAGATIVVTTIQGYRIDDESNRRIYQDNGYLMDHFQGLPAAMQKGLNVDEHGRVPFSFANVMKLLGPIVIMDEAHNARTRISFDSLARMGPLAVLELTATPIQEHNPAKEIYASNVLHAVSALQLKREGMIKLPVDLESRKDWLDVLARAVETRTMLAARAALWGQNGGRFIRPIALIQAQPRNKNKETHTADKVKAALIEKLKVPAENIRIATGDNDDLGDEDLSGPECKVEYVVTVDKLREGWDCPLAYVLGSVGNVATETAVEQLLGRILRMPHAKPTGVPELDRAYAIVQSEDVARVAASLADSMVNRCGFDRESVKDVFRIHRQSENQPSLPFTAIPVSAAPDLAALASEVKAKVSYEPDSKTIVVHKSLTSTDVAALGRAVVTDADKAAVNEFWQTNREPGTTVRKPDEQAPPFRVPQLAIRDGQLLLPFEPIELDEFDWNLKGCNATLTDEEFSAKLHVGDHVLLDVTVQGAVKVGGIEEVIVRQQSLFANDDHWEKPELVRWFDRELRRGGKNAGLTAAESQAWLNRLVDHLTGERGIAIPILVRKRHELADLIYHRILDHGRQQVRKAAHNLFGSKGQRRLETTAKMSFELPEDRYMPYGAYAGAFQYRKHAFDKIGKMGDEESHCAKKLDDHANVKRWIRNLESESAGGYSLPLSPGRFFPDFLAELNDGRLAIVEYKGDRDKLPEEQHKKAVGELWAARSAGTCVFAWVVDRDWATVERTLRTIDEKG